MRKTQFWIGMGCCLLVASLAAHSQSNRKPGLYEVTAQISMAGMPQMPQLPPGTQLPPGVQMPSASGMMAPRTTQVCVTQAMIDRFGGPSPAPQRGNCQVTNVSIRPDGMSADIKCTGQMNATGNVQATFVDANTIQSKMHISGTMQMGQNSRPVDMSVNSTSIYKGPDCGDVKPPNIPAN